MKNRLAVLLLLLVSFLLLFSAAEAAKLQLPAGVTEIPDQAFMNNKALDEVVLPEGIKTIGSKAFANSSLKKINLPKSISSIADDAFEGCTGVEMVATPALSIAYFWPMAHGFTAAVGELYDKTVKIYQRFELKVNALGVDLSYRWQFSNDGGETWDYSRMDGYDTDTLSGVAYSSMDGRMYRCAVTPPYGVPVVSEPAVLTVVNPTYRALLIGETRFYKYNKSTKKYYNEDATRNSVDVTLMKNMLSSVKGPSGGTYTVTTGINKGYDEIQDLIYNTFKDTTENDVSLFCISTHGAANSTDSTGHITARQNGDLWMPFMGTEEEMNDAECREDYCWTESDGIMRNHMENLSFDTLAYWLKTYVKGEVIVLIESCGAGAAIWESDVEQNSAGGSQSASSGSDPAAVWTGRAISAFRSADPGISVDTGGIEGNTGEMRILNKFYVLAAARYGENSYGNDTTGNLFIRELVNGVGTKDNSPADTDGNGTLDLAELYQYIRLSDGQYGWSSGYNDWYGEYMQHVQRYPASGEGSTYPMFSFD